MHEYEYLIEFFDEDGEFLNTLSIVVVDVDEDKARDQAHEQAQWNYALYDADDHTVTLTDVH